MTASTLFKITTLFLLVAAWFTVGLSCSTENRLPRNCQEVYARGCTASGVYTIDPRCGGKPFQVYCNMEEGQYTVFQRRMDGSVNFYRNWKNYSDGFGDLEGEHWLGLDRIHCLTTRYACAKLRVTMKAFDGTGAEANYEFFNVGNRGSNYRLNVAGYSGTAGDSLAVHNNASFSTFDVDNDAHSTGNCASVYKGGFWYAVCHTANPNGLYLNGGHASYANGVNWLAFAGYHRSLKFVEMKMKFD